MRRRWRCVWAVTAALAAAAGCGVEEQQAGVEKDPERQRVVEFWASFRRANQLRLEGKFEDAAAGYREALKRDPSHEDSLYYLGTSLEQQGKYTEAAEAYEKLIEVNPASGRGFSQLGRLLGTPTAGALPDYERARRMLERAREINPEQAGPFLDLGRVELNQGKIDAAIEHFGIAARFGAPEGHYWLGQALFENGRTSEAAEHLRRVLAAYEKERKMAGAGIRAEGDVRKSPAGAATPLELAAERSRRLLERIEAGLSP